MIWAADSGSNPDIWGALLQYGLPGIVVALFLLGWLIPRGAYDAVKDDRDQWRKAFETEREAHVITRSALAEANGRADAAVEAAKTAAGTLAALQHLPSGGH